MKKVFPILLILFALTLILQYVVNLMITEHEVEYSIKTDDNSYYITESFRSLSDESFYDFTVRDENDSFFVFSFNEDLNRQEEVIKDIKFFTTKDLQCIFPIYKRNKTGNLSCIYNNQLVSYSYLEQINNYDITLMTKKLKDMGYKHDDWENKTVPLVSVVENEYVIEVYQENILEDYIFTIWDYRGLVIMNSAEIKQKTFLNEDYYHNINSALVGKYYVTVDQGEDDFNYFRMYNIKDFGKGVINTEQGVALTRNFYFNGVFKNKLYVTDLGKKQQFEVNPITEKALVVGNEEDGFLQLKDEKLVRVDAKKFLSSKTYFNNNARNEVLSSLGAVDIIKVKTSFYYRTVDGSVYRVNENNLYKPALLFKLDGLTEWRVKNGDILAVAGNTVYFYNEAIGLRPIAIHNELIYNHYNIVDFWKG